MNLRPLDLAAIIRARDCRGRFCARAIAPALQIPTRFLRPALWEIITRQQRFQLQFSSNFVPAMALETQNPSTPPDSLIRALRTLLRPLVRMLISKGLTLPYFTEILKAVYVDAPRILVSIR